MRFKLLTSFILLFSLLAQLPCYAAPTLTVDFCSSGFRVTIAPTTEGVIYVSTGLYTLEPMNAGECIAVYDPPTQRTHFYLVNSSGAYYIGWYYEYGARNKTLSKLLNKVKRSTVPVFGNRDSDQVIFSFNNITYKVPVKELSPYLWSEDLLDNLVAFSYEDGIVIVPAAEIDVVERNFTVIKKPGKHIGTTLLDFNFTYWLSYRYPLYLNGTIDGVFKWRRGEKRDLTTWEELLQMFNKPLYIFYFDGESLKPYPLLRIEILLKLRKFELTPKYEFKNLAPSYTVSNTSPPNTPLISTTSSTGNLSTYYILEDTREGYSLWVFLLLFIIVILALVNVLLKVYHYHKK